MKQIFKSGKRQYYLNDNNKRVYVTNWFGKKIYFTDDFVNISYRSNNSVASSLSNHFPYDFPFRGYYVKSVEGLLQSLKYEDLEVQYYLFNYYGEDAHHIKTASYIDDWRNKGYLYFMGKPINRFDGDYQKLLNDLYLSLNRNPLFSNILKYTGKRILLDTNGINDPCETILTPREYIDRLTIIRDALSKSEAQDKLDQLSVEITNEYSNLQKTKQLTKL